MISTGVRMPAVTRREAIVAAAIAEFAASGYAGTPVEAIARRVGVTQPYVFRLFGTKKSLFLAAVRAGFGRTQRLFAEAGEQARRERKGPTAVLDALASAYRERLADRDLLRLQLQAYAACDDPEIRAAVTAEMRAVYQSVARLAGADRADLDAWFRTGMALNVLAVISPPEATDLAGWLHETSDEGEGQA
jgi:AcrR family transcriptional regulator